MPHVIVKMLAGRSDVQKKQLADEITKVVMRITGNDENAMSVSVEDILQSEWMEKVYKPDIEAHWDKLYKEPGYGPLAK
jgi:4-oxalocrotonate tautomerase